MAVAAEIVLEMDPLLDSIKEKLQVIGSQTGEVEEPCTIYRVVPSIRGEEGAAFDPKIISIGPFHRNKKHLLPMEDIKWCYLHKLLSRVQENTLEKLLGVVRAQAPQARKMYSEKLCLEPDAFVKMLLLDGCFIVEFLVRFLFEENHGQLSDTNWKMPLVRSDLLLLENQIPFFILQSLFDSSVASLFDLKNQNEPPITLKELALSYVTLGRLETLPEPVNNVKIHHLLHLFQISLTPNPALGGPQPFSCMKILMQFLRKCKRFIIDLIIWSLSICLCCFAVFRRHSYLLPSKRDSSRAPRTIPSATELQEAGIIFKKRKMNQEMQNMCYLDVKFEDGIMEIPCVPIQAMTISLFHNLIAFEQCYPNSGSHFTSYAALMDNLINTPMDVAVLRDCGIIESKLGSDNEVAIFFNQLCKGGYLDYENHYLAEVFKDVRKFSSSSGHRWRAMLVRDYFSNPWAIISFAAAFVLLGLTIVQTVFSILTYVCPPKQPT
ncbi:UPF0481 protein At3g47200-like [Dioscorea cayenensis subsp. rotundata]|uniref:UPF0481 protein At3g47200-like n=1 Tax=Dioscorea cayennensis subsp. rotundata TaxID=55577 RepID=A0AB40BMX5_DIOCR|nr:UPF0481 protein At3g47200-like [Dioscorea cayenensis subsp. rotundata]